MDMDNRMRGDPQKKAVLGSAADNAVHGTVSALYGPAAHLQEGRQLHCAVTQQQELVSIDEAHPGVAVPELLDADVIDLHHKVESPSNACISFCNRVDPAASHNVTHGKTNSFD